MMRILHVLPTFGIGGTELRVVSLINGLGTQFSHLVLPLNGVTTATARLERTATVDVIRAPKSGGLWHAQLELKRIFARVRPDLVLTYNWGAIDAVVAARLAGGVPVIHNECGFGPDEASRLKKRRVLFRRFLLNGIPATIVVSSVLENIALNVYGLRRDRVRFIRTGVDTNVFAPGRNLEIRHRLGISKSHILFGYVGGLRPEKNPQFLVKAFANANVPDSRLVLIGDGPLRQELEGLVANLGLRNRVKFVGPVNDTPAWYRALDVFLMSSSTEQTPNALLEAMASGLPAICTDAGDTNVLLSASVAQTVAPIGDLDAYTNLMKRIAATAELRIRLGEQNRQECLAKYSRARMIDEYRRVYLSCYSSGTIQ